MKFYGICLLFLLFGQLSAQSTSDPAKPKPDTTTAPPTTTAADTTVPTTEAPTTTAPTTAAPKTTAPTTTASKTTAPPTTAPKTTAAPTTAAPTTAAPTKVPATTVGPATEAVNNYTVYKEKKACLLAKFKGHFSDGKNTWHIGPDATVNNDSSDCGNLFVTFKTGTFQIEFNKTDDHDKVSYWIQAVYATLTVNKTSLNVNVTDKEIAKVSNGSSYMCEAGISIGMSNNVTFEMTNVQLQPYWVGTDGKFATALQCSADISDSILVPIIVGCALGGLIVIVLFAYCIARARVHRKYDPVDNSI